jgi:CHAT domain-containing protein
MYAAMGLLLASVTAPESIPLTAGQYLELTVYPRQADVAVELWGPDGGKSGEFDARRDGPERVHWIAAQTGVHRVSVRPDGARYRLVVNAVRTPTAADRARAAAAAFFREAKYEESLALWCAAGEAAGQALTLERLAALERTKNRPDRAVELLQRALLLWRSRGDRSGEAGALLALGSAHRALGDRDQAMSCFRRALVLCRASGDRYGEAEALQKIGVLYEAVGHQEALRYLQRALALFRAGGFRSAEASTLSRLGMLRQTMGNAAGALQYLEAARSIYHSLGDAAGELEVLQNLGYVHFGARDYAGASNRFREVLQRRSASGDRSGEASAHLGLAEALRAGGRLAEAREHAESAVAIIESLRESVVDPASRMSYFSLKEGYHKTYIKILMDGGLAGPALEASERVRARAFLESLGASPLRLAEIQRQTLDADTLLLEYTFTGDPSHLWAASAEEVAGYVLPHCDTIMDLAYRATALLTDPARADSAEYRQAAQEISRMLLGPVADRLTARRLVIVGEGPLETLPFAALPHPQTGLPLGATHEIVYVPSASTLTWVRRRAAARTPADRLLAVLADPVFDAGDPRLQSPRAQKRPARGVQTAAQRLGVGRLPHSRREGEEILALAPPGSALRAFDFAASRTLAASPELARYRMLHFATHGVLDLGNPELSGIVLSLVDERGRPQDGLLRLRDLNNLHLAADLVVLSACRTGLGKDIEGEGVIGLARGFLKAGALRVVVSLWQVDDEATAELMKLFYRGMLGLERLAPAAALRKAQLALAQQPRWRSPYYWAGFVLHGDWR